MLLAHSRGGLVGDLLGHGGVENAFPEELFDRYGLAKSQKPTYRRLNELLISRAPRVERFLRVGCPASGTTLASGRLDIYLSILVNLIGKIPAVGPFLEGLGELVAAQHVDIRNAFHRARVEVGAEFLVAKHREAFFQAELKPVTAGNPVA